MAPGSSEPLPPSWESSINFHCVPGCDGPSEGIVKARGGQGRVGQRYALAMILLHGLVERPNKISYCGHSLLRGQRREKTVQTHRENGIE